MRAAIAAAKVGDDALGDDPTTRELEERIAEVLGVESALFFPSGIMANQCAIASLARPGTEVLLGELSHIRRYEEGAAAALGGAQLYPVPDPGGRISIDALEEAMEGRSRYRPEVSAVLFENTHLESGGKVVPVDALERSATWARARGLGVHLDGARLWNAAAATGAGLPAWTASADTVMVSLSKGLGAPVGSVLGSTRARQPELWRLRRRFGGAMRQSGLLAAAALFALDHHRARLVDDHRNARELAAGIDGVNGFRAIPPDTNIVIFEVGSDGPTPEQVVAFLREHRILMIPFGGNRVRAVTHLDVNPGGISRAIRVLAKAAEAQ